MSSKRYGFRHSIESPFALVVVLLVAVYVGAPFAERLGAWGDMVPACVLAYALGLAIHATGSPRVVVRAGYALALLVVAGALLHDGTDSDLWAVLSRLGYALLSATAFVAMLRFVLAARDVEGEEIFAAIAAYILLGTVWSHLYMVLYISGLDAPAFSGLEGVESDQVYSTLAYFSYVTLTTLGYGEIVPVNSYARSLATFEAIAGQLFVAVLLARLVALQTASRTVGSSGGDDRGDA